MNKLFLAGVLSATLAATTLSSSLNAAEAGASPINTATQTMVNAIAANPELADSILAAAIVAANGDEAAIAELLTEAVNAGMDADTVTSVAVANGVDATVASQATAAGSNNANPNGNQASSGNANGNAGAGNNNAGGSGGGGGGGGASNNQ